MCCPTPPSGWRWPARRASSAKPAPWRGWPRSACKPTPPTTRRNCPAACSSASGWPGLWRGGPDILLMEGAFSALDPLKRVEMQSLLLDLQREQQRTVLFVSHDLEEALRIGNRIAIMEGGNLVQEGTAHQIITEPANAYVRKFFEGVDTSRYLTAADLLDP